MLRALLSLVLTAALIGPAAVDVAHAKSARAEKKAAKMEAKKAAKEAAKAKAKSKGKKVAKKRAAEKKAAKEAQEALETEKETAANNAAMIKRILWLAETHKMEDLKKLGESLKTKEEERHKLVVEHYEPIAAKAPAE